MSKVSVVNLLDILDELEVKLSFAVLGITAELYPNLIADVVARGHEVFGHGMYHEPAFQGRPYAEQRHEMRRMRDSIEAACGIAVIGALPVAGQGKLLAERHLGLVTPAEHRGVGKLEDELAALVESGVDCGAVLDAARRAPPLTVAEDIIRNDADRI